MSTTLAYTRPPRYPCLDNAAIVRALQFLNSILAVHTELRYRMLGVPASGRAPDLPASWVPSHAIPVILAAWRPAGMIKCFRKETQRLYRFVQDGLARRWREAFDTKITGSLGSPELNLLWDRLITEHLQAQQEVRNANRPASVTKHLDTLDPPPHVLLAGVGGLDPFLRSAQAGRFRWQRHVLPAAKQRYPEPCWSRAAS